MENQKAVYLIVDTKTGKKYVGSAYGDNMLLGRWRNYIANGHGGNKLLKSLDFEYIKENFKYSMNEDVSFNIHYYGDNQRTKQFFQLFFNSTEDLDLQFFHQVSES